MSDRHLVLVGMMGAGKSSVGARCAQRLDRPFVDVDEVVVATSGQSIAEIFAAGGEADGEARFRELERQAVADVCASPNPLVIACGGGAVLDGDNRRRLRDAGTVIWLYATPDELAERVASAESRATRPLLADGDPRAELARLVEMRRPAYELAAHARIETGGRDVDAVADAVLEELARCAA